MSASLQSLELESMSYTRRTLGDKFSDQTLSSHVVHEQSLPERCDVKQSKLRKEIEVEEVDVEEELPSLLSVLPVLKPGKSAMSDLRSRNVWFDPHLWRAGAVEGAGSACLAFISGALAITLSQWPVAAIPAGVFFGNTALVSIIIYAAASTTGAHINPNITISSFFCGLCHPVRAAVYIFCQLIGGMIGGAFLRAGLGETRAIALHNGGCYIDPHGPVSVGQASALEFMATFSLLYLAYGVGLDPRQAKLYGAQYGPMLVGLLVGMMTGFTSTISPGYTGAGMFPGRCLGLAVGAGIFQKSHWVWWLPDIAACFVHSLLYRFAPPHSKDYVLSPSERALPISAA